MSVEAEIVERETSQALVVRERSSVLLAPVMDLKTAMVRLQEFQEFVAAYLIPSEDGGLDGGDFGAIPGAGKKKVLLKSGADKLGEIYGLYDEYIIDKTVNWDRGLFDFDIRCILRSRRDDSIVGTGVGSCSSFESKYRWRDAQRKCPTCGKENIRRSKKKDDGTGGGWYCWLKTEGCGTTFKDGDKAIEAQVIGRVENPDIIDLKNTVLKMAKKRAKIDAIIGVTRSSGIFTQDLEDVRVEANASLKEPPVVAEAKTFTKPANGTKATTVVPETVTPADMKVAMVEAQKPLDEATPCIDSGMAANFHKLFRDALPPKLRKEAENLIHDWMRDQEIIDITGKPSALAIKKEHFYQVREEAVAFAASCGK